MVILYIKIQNKYKVGSVVGGILGKGGGCGEGSVREICSPTLPNLFTDKSYILINIIYEAELIIEMHCFLLGYV